MGDELRRTRRLAPGLVALALACAGGDATPQAFVPTESRLLGLNDLTFLLPLEGLDTPGLPPPRALVPIELFDRLSTVPGDVITEIDRLRVVALRFDLCDRERAGPCDAEADGSLRLVLQPLLATGEAEDVALHAFYPVPHADMPRVVDELRRLARLQDVPRASALRVNTAFSTDEGYRIALIELVGRYARSERLHRLTLFGQLTLQAALVWVFRGVELHAGRFEPIAIAGIDADEQRVRLFSNTSYTIEPEIDAPSGLLNALSDTGFERADDAQRTLALETLAAVDNPARHTAHTVQCVACHASTTVLAPRASLAGVAPDALTSRFTSNLFDLTPLGEETLRPRTLRALGYLQKWPMVSQRVINETANALGEVERRHPPAP